MCEIGRRIDNPTSKTLPSASDFSILARVFCSGAEFSFCGCSGCAGLV
jgi:hypothetical protein